MIEKDKRERRRKESTTREKKKRERTLGKDRQKVPNDSQGDIKDIPLDRKAERARHNPLCRTQQDTSRHDGLFRILKGMGRELFPVLDCRLVVHQLVDVSLFVEELVTRPLGEQRELLADECNLAGPTPDDCGGS